MLQRDFSGFTADGECNRVVMVLDFAEVETLEFAVLNTQNSKARQSILPYQESNLDGEHRKSVKWHNLLKSLLAREIELSLIDLMNAFWSDDQVVVELNILNEGGFRASGW